MIVTKFEIRSSDIMLEVVFVYDVHEGDNTSIYFLNIIWKDKNVLARSLPKSFQRRELLRIYVSTFFGVNSFRNT